MEFIFSVLVLQIIFSLFLAGALYLTFSRLLLRIQKILALLHLVLNVGRQLTDQVGRFWREKIKPFFDRWSKR